MVKRVELWTPISPESGPPLGGVQGEGEEGPERGGGWVSLRKRLDPPLRAVG